MKNKGFTLVELSIVLVIIGLLIGGILVAQSMIQTAKIQRLTRDIQQYEVAINNFRTTYKQLPGDDSFFVPPGNNNGSIDGAGCAVAPNATLSAFEGYQAFAHLSQAGMIKGPYASFSPITTCAGTHSNNYINANNAGIVAPFTDLDKKAATAVGTAKYSFNVYNQTGTAALGIVFDVNASYVIPLESKFGQNSASATAIGLFNYNNFHGCIDVSATLVPSCYDSTAAAGQLAYFMSF